MVAVDRAYHEGANIVVLSDRGVDENHVAIPSLLAVSAVEQHLVRTRKRTAVSILLESAEPREVHHFAALLGYAPGPSTPTWWRRPSSPSSRRGFWTRTSTPPCPTTTAPSSTAW